MVRKLLTIGVFLALPMLFLYPLWTSPTCAGEDDLVAYYPMRVTTARELLAGRWPAWNRFEAAGVPMFADPQYAVLHPSTLLFVALPGRLAYALSVFLAFSVAGGGAYLYLRRIGLAAPAAWFGAIAFMFCGFLVAHRVHLGIVQTAAMLPWGLWAFEGLRRLPIVNCQLPIDGSKSDGSQSAIGNRRSAIRAFLWLVPIFLLTLSAGHWPTAIHMAVIWAAYFFLRCIRRSTGVSPVGRTGILPVSDRDTPRAGRPWYTRAGCPCYAAVASFGRGLAPVAAAGVVAAAVFAPQIAATASWLGQSTRANLPYTVVGENSFFPLAGVLAFFPFLMGNRTPNFFGHSWWGPWHQCEMLGYVGLVTLPLAIGAIWTLFGRRKRGWHGHLAPFASDHAYGRPGQASPSHPHSGAVSMVRDHTTHTLTSEHRLSVPPEPDDLRSLVRTWTFILIGAGLWMLGTYLPTYRLIYAIPIIGKVRCPARMLLAVDIALAVLAAIAVHVIATARNEASPYRRRLNDPDDVQSKIENRKSQISTRLCRIVFRLTAFALPALMLLSLVLLHGLALASKHWTWFGEAMGPLWGGLLVGSPDDAIAATKFSNPAAYVPAIVAFLTVGFLWFVMPMKRRARWFVFPLAAPVALLVGPLWFVFRRPHRRVWMLVMLIGLDLFVLARFVDVPPQPDPTRDPELSAVAEWLARNGPKEPYRVLAIGHDYHSRAGELLLPKVNGLHHVESISYYGPLGPRDHAWLFGFRPWGENNQLEWLLRTNHLLSLFNVRYIIVEDYPRPAPPPLYMVRKPGIAATILSDVRIPQVTDKQGNRATVGEEGSPNLLGSSWDLSHGKFDGEIVRLQAPSVMKQAKAFLAARPDTIQQLCGDIDLQADRDLELSVQLRAPNGAGAPVSLYVPCTSDGQFRVDAEQLESRWREFRGRGTAFVGSLDLGALISTQSTMPIEIRKVRLVISKRWEPTVFPNSPRIDREFVNNEQVYVIRTPGGLPPSLRPEDPPVYIYENLLCLPRRFPVEEVVWLPDNVSVIDELRYHADKYDLTRQVLMAGPLRDIQVKEFVSENPAAPGLGRRLPANGLGSVILADAPAGVAPAAATTRSAGVIPLWSLIVSAFGILAYLGLGLLLFRLKA